MLKSRDPSTDPCGTPFWFVPIYRYNLFIVTQTSACVIDSYIRESLPKKSWLLKGHDSDSVKSVCLVERCFEFSGLHSRCLSFNYFASLSDILYHSFSLSCPAV